MWTPFLVGISFAMDMFQGIFQAGKALALRVPSGWEKLVACVLVRIKAVVIS